MGYSGDYSIYARSFSEIITTSIFCFLLGCLLANKLLPKTKASDLNFGWVAFSIGLSVFAPVQAFGHISAQFNPAVTLAVAITGDINWLDVPIFCICQLLGAFLGTVLVWLFYLPTFETEPEPAPTEEHDRLLHTKDDLNASTLNFVSYSTRPESAVPAAGVGIRDFRRLLSDTRSEPNDNKECSKVVNICDRSVSGIGPTSRSVSVAYIDQRLHVVDGNTSLERRWSANPINERKNTPEAGEIAIDIDSQQSNRRQSTNASFELGPVSTEISVKAGLGLATTDSAREFTKDASNESPIDATLFQRVTKSAKKLMNGTKTEKQVLDPKLVASLIADQEMKLSIFCTRPPRYLPISNLINEILSTSILVLGVLFIQERSRMFEEGRDLFTIGIFPFLIGIYVTVLVVCFGGMGVSMNPARELGSRFAHWILPINGKGRSEWFYAWITIVGPFIGGAIGGALFLVMKELNKY
eukprot:g7891.t1